MEFKVLDSKVYIYSFYLYQHYMIILTLLNDFREDKGLLI